MQVRVAHYGLIENVQKVHILNFFQIPIIDGQIWYLKKIDYKNPSLF
jgi:hypothetical protein